MTKSLEALTPGKYAILYLDNWDGEGDTYHTLANLEDDGRWLDNETGKQLLEYKGDEILKVWPLDDGFEILSLKSELERTHRDVAELEKSRRAVEETLIAATDNIAELESRQLSVKLPDASSKAFWSGSGKTEQFHPETYKRWVKEAIERAGDIAKIQVEVK